MHDEDFGDNLGYDVTMSQTATGTIGRRDCLISV